MKQGDDGIGVDLVSIRFCCLRFYAQYHHSLGSKDELGGSPVGH